MSGEIRIEFVEGHADVWRLFDDPAQLREIAEALAEPFRGDVTEVAGIESRGFIIGTAAALELGVGFVPVRKADGLFPGPKAVAEAGTDYRGNRHTLRVQRAALVDGDRVLLVDDWIETGSQAAAAKQLVESCGSQLVGIAKVVTELPPEAARGLGRLHALVRR